MNRFLTSMSALALITTNSACNRTEAPADNAAGINDVNATAPDAPNVFAESEMKMDRAMTAAVGTSASDNWVRKMIEHHRGAVDMSRIALAQGVNGDIAKMAQMTIDKQGQEIIDLQKLVKEGAPSLVSAELYKPSSMKMHSEMSAANGGNLSETFLRKMLAHHEGAVAMSDVALAKGATGAVRAQIKKTRVDQQMEVNMVQAMLRGEPMMSMAPAAKSPEATKPPAKATATETPDAHAGMDMNKM